MRVPSASASRRPPPPAGLRMAGAMRWPGPAAVDPFVGRVRRRHRARAIL